jgi:gliding motility-associated-like protein
MKKIAGYLCLVIFIVLVGKTSNAQLQFIENRGQWNNRIDFKSDISNGAFFLENNGFTVVLHNGDDLQKFSNYMHGEVDTTKSIGDVARTTGTKLPSPVKDTYPIHSHAYKVNFLGGSKNVQPLPDKPLDTYNNYFIGNDTTKWKGNCKIYQAVTYRNVYPNIDVKYYTDAGTLKYDLIVHPGGRIDDIALRYEGVDKLEVKNKELIIGTSVGEVKELYPYTYQVESKGRTTVDCKYVVKDNVVRFKVKDYSPDATIIIDPTLIFSSFTGSAVDNRGYTATPGPDGSFFAGGIAYGTGYPTSPGAFSETFNGGIDDDDNHQPYDIAIIKLSSNGVNRLYGTYLGGSKGNEQPHSMICDPQGNLIVAGRTTSSDYPTNNIIGSTGKYDIVVTKFNAAGSALIGSVKIGGSEDDGVNIKAKYVTVPGLPSGAFETRRNYGDDARSEVIVDGGGNICVASSTQSNDFPTTSAAFQKTYGGGRQDGVILKFTPNLSGLVFSTFFGGTGTDACFVLTYNPVLNNLYVGGGTTSPTLPGAGGANPEAGIGGSFLGGETDGFVTQITPDGSAISKTIFAGTGGNDLVYGVQIDKFGSPYIMGSTTGVWPVKNAVFSNTNGKQFIAKLAPDLSSFIYSTVFGSGALFPNISPVAFLVDRCQNVYVSGWGGKYNDQLGYPCVGTNGLPVTPNALKSTTDGDDFYFFVLERNATSQLFGSFFGQTGGFNDHVDGGTSRFDAQGVIYTAICGNCSGPATPGFFPTTPGVWASVNGAPSGCNEAAIKIEMNFGGVIASLEATINGVIDTVGCVPLTITFVDTLAKGKEYIWNYGDPASPKNDTTYAPNNSSTHTYTNVGVYTVTVVSIDSSSCNVADTAYITVRVGNNQVTPDFFATKIPPCSNLSYNFTNTTTAVVPNFTPTSFLWDFGDGSPQVRAGLNTVQHTYASVGTYNVKLVVDDTSFCNAPDSITHQVRLAVTVKAQFETPSTGCVPYSAVFTNTSLGGIDFLWNFGDGTTSTGVDPTHLYPTAGNYTVTLIAYDSSTCNKIDSTTLNITVFDIPAANFTASPNPGLENKPTQFTNLSAGASSYIWNFGDGQTSTEVNPRYQFTSTGIFNVCLQAISPAGCIDTFCLDVSAKVSPLAAVPNAFTPGKFGQNGIIKVEGFGIAKMSWNIYNRWGQLVFSSSNKSQGWDGTFKGALQPMDVYAYTLDIQFTDGQKLRKTGDISLLR